MRGNTVQRPSSQRTPTHGECNPSRGVPAWEDGESEEVMQCGQPSRDARRDKALAHKRSHSQEKEAKGKGERTLIL